MFLSQGERPGILAVLSTQSSPGVSAQNAELAALTFSAGRESRLAPVTAAACFSSALSRKHSRQTSGRIHVEIFLHLTFLLVGESKNDV